MSIMSRIVHAASVAAIVIGVSSSAAFAGAGARSASTSCPGGEKVVCYKTTSGRIVCSCDGPIRN